MITITLTVDKDVFVNDTCICQVTSSRYLRFYSIDESFRTRSGDVTVNRVICALLEVDEDGVTAGYSLPNVIGMSNSVFSITTETPSLEGQLLTLDNIDKCVMEYYDAGQ